MTVMAVKRAKVGWGVWLQWVLANVAGWAVGWALFDAIGVGIGGGGAEHGTTVRSIVAHFVGLFMIGAAGGVSQWLVLRRQVDWAGWAVLGSSLGLAVAFVKGYDFGPPADFYLGFVGAGVVGGILQWLALRRRFNRAGWWMFVSGLGFAIGAAAGIAAWIAVAALAINTGVISLAYENALGNTMLGISHYDVLANVFILAIYGAVGGAVGGAMTGAVLVWLLRQPVPEPVKR